VTNYCFNPASSPPWFVPAGWARQRVALNRAV
jgi:hypothetical protein